MSEKIYDVPADWTRRAYVKDADYQAMYQRSIADPNAFWANEARRIDWFKVPTKIKNVKNITESVTACIANARARLSQREPGQEG